MKKLDWVNCPLLFIAPLCHPLGAPSPCCSPHHSSSTSPPSHLSIPSFHSLSLSLSSASPPPSHIHDVSPACVCVCVCVCVCLCVFVCVCVCVLVPDWVLATGALWLEDKRCLFIAHLKTHPQTHTRTSTHTPHTHVLSLFLFSQHLHSYLKFQCGTKNISLSVITHCVYPSWVLFSRLHVIRFVNILTHIGVTAHNDVVTYAYDHLVLKKERQYETLWLRLYEDEEIFTFPVRLSYLTMLNLIVSIHRQIFQLVFPVQITQLIQAQCSGGSVTFLS